MLTMKELLGSAKLEDQSPEIQKNLQITLDKVNKVRAKWAKAMTPTSGLRTMNDHIRIYKDLASKKKRPFENGIYDESKVPKKTKHLFGQAVDVSDPKLEITAWLKANPEILEEADLYCEEGNSNWVHFQSVPFGSYKKGGTRWFKPY